MLAGLIPATGAVLDHLEGVGLGLPLTQSPLPFIAVPTTSGTGAEATKNAVIDVPAQRRKVSLRDDRMMARLALLEHGQETLFELTAHTTRFVMSVSPDIPEMDKLMVWLPANIPSSAKDESLVSIVHGDYRLDNVMFKQNQAHGQAVLDWELSTLGHPLADLAYFCMCLRLPAGGHIPGLAGKDLQELGLPDEPSIVKRYCELRGIESIPNWHFYLVFSFFRLAAIAQGVLKRALDGNAASDKAMVVGKMTAPLAEMALHIIDTDH